MPKKFKMNSKPPYLFPVPSLNFTSGRYLPPSKNAAAQPTMFQRTDPYARNLPFNLQQALAMGVRAGTPTPLALAHRWGAQPFRRGGIVDIRARDIVNIPRTGERRPPATQAPAPAIATPILPTTPTPIAPTVPPPPPVVTSPPYVPPPPILPVQPVPPGQFPPSEPKLIGPVEPAPPGWSPPPVTPVQPVPPGQFPPGEPKPIGPVEPAPPGWSPMPGENPNQQVYNAARLLYPALAGNPFITREGLARLQQGFAPLESEILPAFYRYTSPVIQQALAGLRRSMGLRLEEQQFTANIFRPRSLF